MIVASGKMSTFGGPEDKGVAADEGLALVEPGDLIEWWFRRVFLPAQPINTTGLARRLNPLAFYIAMRWPDHGILKETARRAIFKLSSPKKPGASVFAQAVDYGPAEWTDRVVDISLGAATALGLTTNEWITVEMIT